MRAAPPKACSTAPYFFSPLPTLAAVACSEITAEGKRVTKLDQILLNGNNVAMLVPGGVGPEGA